MARIRTPATAEALAEFRGFFFGEGHLDIVRQGKGGHNLYPRARIALREDDVEVLRWCVSLFGGCLTYRAATLSWCWQLTGRERVAELVAVLSGGVMPAKKRREVEIVAEALSLIRPRVGTCTRTPVPAEVTARLIALRDDLKAARRCLSVEA